MKLYIKLFTILFVAEMLMGMLAVYLTQGVYIKYLNIIGNLTITILSLPISIIDRSYPYYAPLPFYQSVMLVAVNVAIHALLFKLVLRKR